MHIPATRLEALSIIAEDLKTLLDKDREVRVDFAFRADNVIPRLASIMGKEPKGVQIIALAYFVNQIVNDWCDQILRSRAGPENVLDVFASSKTHAPKP